MARSFRSAVSAGTISVKSHGRHGVKINGSNGDDSIVAGDGDDVIRGRGGDDVMAVGSGADRVDGGRGFDTVVYDGSVFDAVVTHGRGATVRVRLDNGVDTLKQVEALRFDDAVVLLDGTNNRPFTRADADETTNDRPVVLARLLANDLDIDGDRLHIASVSASERGGLVTLRGDGTVLYDPRPLDVRAGATVKDTFTYTVADGRGGTRTETVTMTVNGTNEVPTATDARLVTNTGTDATGILTALDADSGRPLTFRIVDGPRHGTVEVESDGSYAFSPDARFHGRDWFSFRAVDDEGATSKVARVLIDVDGADRVQISTVANDVEQYRQVEVAALTGGGYVVQWESRDPELDDRYFDDAYGYDYDTRNNVNQIQRFDADGVAVGDPIIITGGAWLNPSIAPIDGGPLDGGFVVAIQTSTMGDAVELIQYGPDGDRGNSAYVDGGHPIGQYYPDVAALPGGGSAVTWLNFFGNILQLRLIDPSGEPTSAEIAVSETTGGNTGTAVGLVGGNVVVTWNDGDARDDSSTIARIFSADGTPVTGEYAFKADADGEQSFGAIGALPDGGFVATWTLTDGPETALVAQRFDDGGNTVGDLIPVGDSMDGGMGSRVQGLDGGGFLVLWYDGAMNGQRFDAHGRPDGAAFFISEAGGPAGDDFALTEDGFVTAWNVDDTRIVQAVVPHMADVAVEAKTLIGGAGHDIFVGGRLADSFVGDAGDDSFTGLGGRDTFLTDFLGDDTILDFEAGWDRLDLSATRSKFGDLDTDGDGRLDVGEGGHGLSVAREDGALVLSFGDGTVALSRVEHLSGDDLVF